MRKKKCKRKRDTSLEGRAGLVGEKKVAQRAIAEREEDMKEGS